MADTRYSRLLDLELLRPQVQFTTQTTELQEVADAARDNLLLRVIDLGYLPMDLFWRGFYYHVIAIQKGDASLKLTGDAITRDKWLEVYAEAEQAWLDVPQDNIKRLGSNQVEMICDYHHSSTLVALMSFQVTGVWTAFEALTGDLWERCLNLRPRLGFVALGAEPELDDDETEINRKRKLKFQFPVYLLRELKYDLRQQMGSLLRMGRKWDFARRNEASDAYYKTFKDDKKQLENIFEDKNLQWLAATRNAIVHNAGKANSEFTKLVQHHHTLKSIEIDDPIPVSADLVVDFANTVANRIRELIQFTDAWMINNHE